ncbi:hypothetical protein IJI99_01150, partial [bacterium]|nr:hypothetical protein [bacterium]
MCKDKCNWWLLGLCAIAAIAMIAGIGWFYTHPNKKTSQHTTNQQTTVAHVNPENNQYLQAAKKILDQFDGHTDHRGFYGASQHCSWTNGQEPACIVETMDYLDDGQPIASHRQTLPVIWARYQYYHATGDQEQLAKMHTDLENLWQILNDKTFTLQTNRYNCFLMLDLIQAEDIDYEDRLRARDICRQAEFEYAPGSDLQYDLRLAHLPYKFMTPIAQEEWSTEFPVVTDYEGSVDPEKLVTYNYQSLINDIDNLI